MWTGFEFSRTKDEIILSNNRVQKYLGLLAPNEIGRIDALNFSNNLYKLAILFNVALNVTNWIPL